MKDKTPFAAVALQVGRGWEAGQGQAATGSRLPLLLSCQLCALCMLCCPLYSACANNQCRTPPLTPTPQHTRHSNQHSPLPASTYLPLQCTCPPLLLTSSQSQRAHPWFLPLISVVSQWCSTSIYTETIPRLLPRANAEVSNSRAAEGGRRERQRRGYASTVSVHVLGSSRLAGQWQGHRVAMPCVKEQGGRTGSVDVTCREQKARGLKRSGSGEGCSANGGRATLGVCGALRPPGVAAGTLIMPNTAATTLQQRGPGMCVDGGIGPLASLGGRWVTPHLDPGQIWQPPQLGIGPVTLMQSSAQPLPAPQLRSPGLSKA